MHLCSHPVVVHVRCLVGRLAGWMAGNVSWNKRVCVDECDIWSSCLVTALDMPAGMLKAHVIPLCCCVQGGRYAHLCHSGRKQPFADLTAMACSKTRKQKHTCPTCLATLFSNFRHPVNTCARQRCNAQKFVSLCLCIRPWPASNWKVAGTLHLLCYDHCPLLCLALDKGCAPPIPAASCWRDRQLCTVVAIQQLLSVTHWL